MFILQTEMPNYFNFRTNISKIGELEFYIENRKIDYANISQWINEEYQIGETKIVQTNEQIKINGERLKKIKIDIETQEIEYRAKEKQISTFLECKRTFFGKFKYYFKYSKKKNNLNQKDEKKEKIEEKESNNNIQNKKIETNKRNYTIEELLELYKKFEKIENEFKNIMLDLNSLKLKKKNMDKKIKNATLFIEEIDKHKKSIFEFWKYTNKDKMSSLPEGEEEIIPTKKIKKIFDYEEDLEQFGNKMDQQQRNKLTKQETDSIYISSTNLIDILNKVKNNTVLPKDIQDSLKSLKQEKSKEKVLNSSEEEFDIFGGIIQDLSKISKINDKKHREIPKDKFNILSINKNTQELEYKLILEKVVENIKNAMKKITIKEELPVYKATENKLLDEKEINIFDINPEAEIKRIIEQKENKINFYKINLSKEINGISFTNSIFYDNQNKTLPVGQDLSTKIIVDISKADLKIKNKFSFQILTFEKEKDDFSDVIIKTVNCIEYDI